MPKIRSPPPPYFMKHLVDRFRKGRISVDVDALQAWLNSDPEVPAGKWYKAVSKIHPGRFLMGRPLGQQHRQGRFAAWYNC